MPDRIQKHSLLIIYLIFILIVGAGFFLPFSQIGWGGFVLKSILFLAISCAVYYFMLNSDELNKILAFKNKPAKEEINETPEIKLHSVTEWHGFNNAFKTYYQDFFKVINSSLLTSCIGFYMGSENSEPHFYSGEDGEGGLQGPHAVSPDGLIDLTFRQKEPIVEGNLPIGSTLCGLNECEIRSALTVPLISNDKIVGVLAVGNKTVDHFSTDDIQILIRFGNLLTNVMAICYTGIKWETDRKVYQVHIEFEEMLQHCFEEETVIEAFVTQIRKLFLFDRFTLCRRNGEDGIVSYVYGQIDHIDRGLCFPLDGGLNGWVLKRSAPLIIPDIEEGRYIRPRYFKDEDIKHGLHSYIGIPLAGVAGEAWGCLSLENKLSNVYDAKAKDIISLLAIPFKTAIGNINKVYK